MNEKIKGKGEEDDPRLTKYLLVLLQQREALNIELGLHVHFQISIQRTFWEYCNDA